MAVQEGGGGRNEYGSETVIEESTITETVETGILIVGAGTGGLVAAIVAGSEGVQTLVLEKNARVGYYKTYNGAVGSRAQNAAGVQINTEELIRN